MIVALIARWDNHRAIKTHRRKGFASRSSEDYLPQQERAEGGMAALSDAQHSASDQVREPLPLLRVQERVDILKRTRERLSQSGRTFNAALAGACGLGRIKRLAADGVGKFGQRPPIIDLCLSSLRLEVVEDPHERVDLLLVEVELVREKPQRAPHTESRAALESIGIVMTVRHETPFALAPIMTG
jgi:hypothetical protein